MHRKVADELLALLERSDDLIWSVDLDLQLLGFNQALDKHFFHRFGLHPEVGRPLSDLLPPERSLPWPGLYRKALTEGPYRTEYSLTDGSVMELAFYPLIFESKPTGVLVFGKDISERQAAEESRRLLAAIVESTDDGIATYDLDGVILSWNRGAEAIFGYSAAEAVRANLSIIVPAERQAKVREYSEQVSQGRAILLREGVGVRKDGKRIRISVTSSPLRGSTGKVSSISIIVRDVTGQREAEEAQGLLASLVECSEDVIHGIALDGSITSWNRGAEALFGYSSQDVLGESVRMLAMPERQDRVSEILEAVRTGCAIRVLDTVVRHKDGYPVDVALSISTTRDKSGNLTGACAILRDIRQRKRIENALGESERRFRGIFEKNNSVLMLVDQHNGLIADANPAATLFYGYAREDLIGMPIGRINGLSDEEVSRDAAMAHQEKQGYFRRSHRLASGELREIELYCSPIDLGEKKMLLSIVHDVTKRKQAEAALKESEERFRATFEQAAVGIVHTSFDGQILRSNRRFAEIIGYQPEEIPALSFHQITLPEDLGESLDLVARLANGAIPTASWEKRYLRKDGNITWVRLTSSLQCDAEGRRLHLITVVEDINALKAARDSILQLALHDSLTGLANRNLFMERLEHCLALRNRSPQNNALFFIDLDNFKALNDSFGHFAGDQTLRETANRLLSVTRQADTVARIGGDEFVVLLEGLNASPEKAFEEAWGVAEKILAALGSPYDLDGQLYHCTASIGGLVIRDAIADVDLAVRLVDDAMYEAKAEGRNAIHFVPLEREPGRVSG